MHDAPFDFGRYLASQKDRVEGALGDALPRVEDPAGTVIRAMHYAVLGPGKRLRGILTLAAHEACAGQGDLASTPAAAIELIHAYSLVHDDLPAMDDDDLRRGRPTVHRVYGEAPAILAGDALLTLAFELLARYPSGDARASRRAEAVAVVARRCGVTGLVGGQMADLESERATTDRDRLDWIHRRKTGELFAASAEIGAIHAGAGAERRAALARYGESIGLAFQIADDLLDTSGTVESLGKTPGKDARAGKATYPALYGARASFQHAQDLARQGLDALRSRGLLTEALENLALYSVSRTH